MALGLVVKKVIELIKLLEIHGVHIFSDSSINSHRLNHNPNSFKSFVAPRMLTILKMANHYGLKFHFVYTQENPADIYSRMCTIKEFIAKMF